MARYPLGGNLSWALQYILGMKRAGHEVFIVEKSGYDNSCYDPSKLRNSNDCSFGISAVSNLLSRFDLGHNWCYVDHENNYFGIGKQRLLEIFRTADLYIDSGAHNSWAEESQSTAKTVIIEGEPASTQIKWHRLANEGVTPPKYDAYYSNGTNAGAVIQDGPVSLIEWKHIFNPVCTDVFHFSPPSTAGAYTTIMNWQSHKPIQFEGKTYGQKDVEFNKFIELPDASGVPFLVAISGSNIPVAEIEARSWKICDAQLVTHTVDDYWNFIRNSKAEFSVCKNIFAEKKTGWFSDRSAAYLASGRPVVLQETGFSDALPTGAGLFAFSTLDEAAEAIARIEADYQYHCRKAREIACEFLDAQKVMKKFLRELNVC